MQVCESDLIVEIRYKLEIFNGESSYTREKCIKDLYKKIKYYFSQGIFKWSAMCMERAVPY